MNGKSVTSSSKKSAGTPRNGHRNASLARSEGHRQLLGVPDSMATVARAGGVGKTSVHRWLSGESGPDAEARRNLKKAYKIPVESWDQAPRPEPAVEPDREVSASDSAPHAQLEVPSSSAVHFLDLMTEVRRNRIEGGLSPSERLKAIEREGALRAQYERAKGSDRITEELIVREHPHWARFEETLIRALSKYPDAMREVAEALEKIR
jgi:transcriptional regulator with XRE-family HTH domain